MYLLDYVNLAIEIEHEIKIPLFPHIQRLTEVQENNYICYKPGRSEKRLL
jgi:hypothetical protein